MEKKYTMVLVSHTHWDREWYLPFQEFRIKLVRLTDKLLKILDTDPDFKTFVFDGQTVVLEDYLEIRPQEREHIARLVRSGRLTVGPWYILPDEWLVSGEATVRNLLLGHLIAEQFGKPMKSGYVPDPFGHISQMPQILRNFGIEDFHFSRGRGLEPDEMKTCEFWWEAPDGTRVLAVTQGSGYCGASSLGITRDPDGSTRMDFDLAVDQIAAQRDKLAPLSASTVIPLNNGCDHLEAQPEIPEIIRRANEKLEDSVVIHGTFEDVGRLIKEQKPELHTYRGELRAGKYCGLLPGILSTRMYIKQANERTQTLLEKWTEPFSALANAYGANYDSAMIWTAWKLCLQNHPHDSICGCSIDQVHKEMMVRFDQSQQIGGTLASESLQHLAFKVSTIFEMPEQATPVVVFNAHGWDVEETVTVRMSEMLETGKAPGQFVVRNSSGVIIPCQVVNIHKTELCFQKMWRECDLTFNAGKVPALGYKSFSIERVDFQHPGGQPPLSGGLVASENSLENEYVKVTVGPNGSFDMLDKTTDNLFEGLNLFEDTEDAGDEYDYSPARCSRRITSSGATGTISVAQSGPVSATIRVDTQLELPASLSQDRCTRSSESVLCPVTVSITVRRGSPRVDIMTEFTNNAKDHRLRAWFPVGVAARISQTEGQFCVVERSIDLLPSGPGWNQKPQPEQPQQSFVNAQAEGRGLAVINQGLPECEVMRSSDAVIALTLVRCCAWLSTGDLLTRGGGAGPEIMTPDAQCPGKHTFRYAVYAHGGDWRQAHVWRQAHQHNVLLRPVLTGVHPGTLPNEKSFISVEPMNLVVSALKKADRDDSLILRVYNTTDQNVTASVRLGFAVESAYLANMNEETLNELSVDDGRVSFDMPAFRVQTIRLSL